MTSRALLLACCCALGSLLCAAHAEPVGPSQPSLWSETTLSKVVSAKSVLDILQRPTSVTLFRIQRKEVACGGQTKEEETLADPVVLSQEQAASLSKTLLARGSVGWPPAKECIMRPGVLARFGQVRPFKDTRGRERRPVYTVDLALCFECNMLSLNTAGKNLRAVLDFDPAEAPLLEIIKKAYPTDTQIQQLRPKRVSRAVEPGTAPDARAAHAGSR